MQAKDRHVNPRGIAPELLYALNIAEHVFRAHDSPLIVTSLNDSAEHSRGSLHYRGSAADLRIWHLADPKSCADALRDALHEDFDVVLEPTHIHLEYHPKGP